jgi:hypothetical protein
MSMRDFRAGHLTADHRSAVRPVALAYRRTRRALQARGMDARDANPLALDAAHAAFLALVPEAAGLPRGEISARVNPMIAVAINADPHWFWYGPDA